MRVISMTPGSLEWQCRELAREIMEDNPRGFSFMLGIVPGGDHVMAQLAKFFPHGYIRQMAEVKIHRPIMDNRGVVLTRRLLGHLPLWILNKLREGQQIFYRVKSAMKVFRLPRVELPQVVLQSKASSFLLVDDAIDTGTTLLAVSRALSAAFPEAQQKVVVITLTTDNPLRHPDYAVYTDQTLVRFPWSPDYKG